MQMITSAAGTRLAKAQHRLDTWPLDEQGDPFCPEYGAALDEWVEAATALGAELIANGYHDLDGGEA